MDNGFKISFMRLVQRYIKMNDLKDVPEEHIGTAFDKLEARWQTTKRNITETPVPSDVYKLALILQALPPAQEDE